jgi:AraC-like DNA-binding protein/quercetin dioxygenase-like cupin family protein
MGGQRPATKGSSTTGRRGARSAAPAAEPVADVSYLAYVRPTPPPFTQFVSGHFPPGTSTQRHRHHCLAIHGCLQGPLILKTSKEKQPLEVGDFCLLAPELEHCWENPSRQTGATFGLLVDADHPGRWPAAAAVADSCSRLTRFVTTSRLFRTAHDEELQRAFWAAADHLTAIEPREAIAVTGAILTLVGLCLQRLEGKREEPAAANNDLAVEIRRLLLARVNDRLSIAEIARELRVSPTTAKELFRKAFGTGIIAYHNQLKIWQAKRLLADHSLTVDQVSRKLGFSSHSYFSQVFQQHTGRSPSTFRRGVKP